jgi:ubiquinone/menaquinone biosynthesis C-methylase UbiE
MKPIENNKPTPESFLEAYYESYERVFFSGFQEKGSKYFHKKLESKWLNNFPERVLELGAGRGEHFGFVRDEENSIKEYIALDLKDGSRYKSTLDSGLPVSWVMANAQDLPFENGASELHFLSSVCSVAFAA